MDRLRYDYSFMMNDAVGDTGADISELDELHSKLVSMRHDYFLNDRKKLGFMSLPFEADSVQIIQSKSSEYRKKFKSLLVLGIGGSDLGARAVISALKPVFNSMREDQGNVYFLGGNTDPTEIDEILHVLDLRETAVNVISKSGDTVETMSTFLYIREQLIQTVGYEEHKKHIIATTDATSGTLRVIVDREGYDSLIVPGNVGGRFSVLSTVGLFPIAFSGIDIEELLGGARAMCESLFSATDEDFHQTEVFAALHYLGQKKRNQPIHVFIPYSAHLREVGFWFRQLWAESLGKKDTLEGEEIFLGPTPIAALGATDQHSQFQLYYYGPFDKLITFVQVERFAKDFEVPAAFEDIEGISYMKGLRFGDILNTELYGSSLALAERNRPNGRLILPQLNAHTIGQLLQFLEIATAYMGGLLHINTYDQPAVELGKHNVYALLHRKGFEKRETELEKLMQKYNNKIV